MPHVFVSCFLLIWAVVAMAKKSRADYSPAPLSMAQRVSADYPDQAATCCGPGSDPGLGGPLRWGFVPCDSDHRAYGSDFADQCSVGRRSAVDYYGRSAVSCCSPLMIAWYATRVASAAPPLHPSKKAFFLACEGSGGCLQQMRSAPSGSSYSDLQSLRRICVSIGWRIVVRQ